MTSKQGQPPQDQPAQPGREGKMRPKPEPVKPDYRGCGKLAGEVAIVTGGDSGIGRAVAVAFAMEGADVAIGYLDEHDDAAETTAMVKQAEQLERAFRTNVFAIFRLVRAALPHMPKGGGIINTTSVTAYTGHPVLLDYSATKGAIVAFTRSLSQNLADKDIRVNAVAPGPIWTPLIPATFEAEQVEKFGTTKPMGRAGEPSEVAPSYVFPGQRRCLIHNRPGTTPERRYDR